MPNNMPAHPIIHGTDTTMVATQIVEAMNAMTLTLTTRQTATMTPTIEVDTNTQTTGTAIRADLSTPNEVETAP